LNEAKILKLSEFPLIIFFSLVLQIYSILSISFLVNYHAFKTHIYRLLLHLTNEKIFSEMKIIDIFQVSEEFLWAVDSENFSLDF
jgi:hypothetical protein